MPIITSPRFYVLLYLKICTGLSLKATKVIGNNMSSRNKHSKPAKLTKPELGILSPRILLCTCTESFF